MQLLFKNPGKYILYVFFYNKTKCVYVCVCKLRCHLNSERSDIAFIMNPPRPFAPATPIPAPKQEAGMLGFHDANEVKTWQCVTGSLGAAPDLWPPSHQDQSLIPL